jgi:hypothetical protein
MRAGKILSIHFYILKTYRYNRNFAPIGLHSRKI